MRRLRWLLLLVLLGTVGAQASAAPLLARVSARDLRQAAPGSRHAFDLPIALPEIVSEAPVKWRGNGEGRAGSARWYALPSPSAHPDPSACSILLSHSLTERPLHAPDDAPPPLRGPPASL